jgi:hypothetical protein
MKFIPNGVGDDETKQGQDEPADKRLGMPDEPGYEPDVDENEQFCHYR